jgi:hypothetical protein
LALFRRRLEVARGTVCPDEVGGGCPEIKRLKPTKARQPLRRGRALLIVSDQAQQVIPDAQPVQIGTTPQLTV